MTEQDLFDLESDDWVLLNNGQVATFRRVDAVVEYEKGRFCTVTAGNIKEARRRSPIILHKPSVPCEMCKDKQHCTCPCEKEK